MKSPSGRSGQPGTCLCGALAVLLAACSGKTVDLGGRADKGGGGAGASAGSGGGASGGGGVPPIGGWVVSSGDVADPTPTVTRSRKLDLLLMVDNSSSMADKQQALKVTIPDLVNRLTAASPGITDLHVGVISSSLGDHGGGDTCSPHDYQLPLLNEELDDNANLITTRPRGAALGIPDVISWDSTQSTATLIEQIQDVVVATGEFGCGFEAQFESIYRFLVDPVPPRGVGLGPCAGGSSEQCAFVTGRDTALLAQRAAFLRPDSAVAVVMLTDENDCSIKDEGQFYRAATSPPTLLLSHGSAACAANPNDACCYSCGATPPPGCASDPSCVAPTSTAQEDQGELRCFDQKRRFGMDFLYPVERYVNAFTRSHICTYQADLAPNIDTCKDRNGQKQEVEQNPLFYGADGTIRARSLVFLLGIVGVPWQDLLVDGPSSSTPVFRSPNSLVAAGTWDAIVGDPAASPPRAPTDGLMVESRGPRSLNDINGVPIPGPEAPPSDNNAMNGHDFDTHDGDLMYACVFPLPEPRNCTETERANPSPDCDCGANRFDPQDHNPLCQSLDDGTYSSDLQYSAKAYPGTRELSLLKALGSQGLTASVCPKNLTDVTRNDYGYRPAVDLLIDALKATVP